MRKVFHLLVGLLLLFVDFAHAEHHHKDHQLHIDCSLCVLQHNQIDQPSAEVSLRISLFYFSIEKPQKPRHPYYKPFLKTTHNRAPPIV
ncbi:MAG: hypothetical protein ACK4VK_03630 [Aquificaceae bacterium]